MATNKTIALAGKGHQLVIHRARYVGLTSKILEVGRVTHEVDKGEGIKR